MTYTLIVFRRKVSGMNLMLIIKAIDEKCGNRRFVRIVKNLFQLLFRTWQYPGYEADDLVGILATAIPNCLIVSNDKDLNQIPGNHYDPQKNKLFTVTVDEARKQKYMQWIHGDSVDGIPGIPGIGPRKAEKFLDSLGFPDISEPEATDHVRAWYKECGKFEQPELYCELTRKMTWILTDVLGA